MGHPLAQPQLDAIAAACQQHQERRMHLFGSVLRDGFDPTRSDLDLLVEFQLIEPGPLVEAYFGLEQQLASITGQSVDLVMADAVRNPYVRRDIEASKQRSAHRFPGGAEPALCPGVPATAHRG